MSDVNDLLIWTENYWIGGCDRFLADLLDGLREVPVRVSLAGNPHPEFDAWLRRRAPWILPRSVIPVANLVRTPLHRLDRWRSPSPGTASGVEAPPEHLAWSAAIAAARYGQAALNLERLRRLLRRAKPDVLLINNGGYPGAESCRVAAIAARQAGVGRVVQFVHNMAHPPAWPSALERALDREIDRCTDRWITAADRASDELSRQRRIPRERISTVHYGIAMPAPADNGSDPSLRSQLGFAPDRPGLVAVANLEPRKGLSELVRALAQLRAQGIEPRTALVGEGPLRSRIEGEISELGLGGTVRLLGWRDDVEAILREADMLALPSLANECLPYVILEAMAQGLPVVSTDVAGIPEMVLDGQTGRVVAPGDVGALAGALAEMVTDVSGARAMGERGYERVRDSFGSGVMMSEMLRLLEVT